MQMTNEFFLTILKNTVWFRMGMCPMEGPQIPFVETSREIGFFSLTYLIFSKLLLLCVMISLVIYCLI
jgi:hypothetical protein